MTGQHFECDGSLGPRRLPQKRADEATYRGGRLRAQELRIPPPNSSHRLRVEARKGLELAPSLGRQRTAIDYRAQCGVRDQLVVNCRVVFVSMPITFSVSAPERDEMYASSRLSGDQV